MTVTPETGEAWTVANESLPELQFDPIQEYSTAEQVEKLRAAFDRLPELQLDDGTLERFVTGGDPAAGEPQLTCHYTSRRSENVLTKSGTRQGIRSVYDAEANRAKHQSRFAGADGRYYRLVDTAADAKEAVLLYSVAVSRHWDSELGRPVEIELTKSE